MKELVLIDGDLITYPVAAASENELQETAEVWADGLVQKIIYETNANSFKIFLTGSGNFRYNIYHLYKANRVGKPKPKHLASLRDFLVRKYGAIITEGNEADDELGIEQTAEQLNSVIATFDKDLLQVPGYHYNWKTNTAKFVSPFDGLRTFYGQILAGDGADNIPSYDGKLRSSVPQFIQKLQAPLQEMTEEYDMYEYVKSVHEQPDMLHTYARCLYVQRKPNDLWQPPLSPGQKAEDEASL